MPLGLTAAHGAAGAAGPRQEVEVPGRDE